MTGSLPDTRTDVKTWAPGGSRGERLNYRLITKLCAQINITYTPDMLIYSTDIKLFESKLFFGLNNDMDMKYSKIKVGVVFNFVSGDFKTLTQRGPNGGQWLTSRNIASITWC